MSQRGVGEVAEKDLLAQNTDLAKARRLIDSGYSLALVKKGETLYVSDGSGVKPLLEASFRLGTEVAGASLGDRVVGLAVARVAVHLGVAGVYGRTGSEKAAQELDCAGVPYVFEKTVTFIMNKTGTGPCPMESLASSMNTPKETYEALVRVLGRKTPP